MKNRRSHSDLRTRRGTVSLLLRLFCKTVLPSFSVLVLLMSFSCSRSTATGPGGTDFPNTRTITGKVVHGDDSPGSFTEVRLVAEDHIPTGGDAATCSTIDSTDSSGSYSFEVSGTGTFNLQAIHLTKRTRLFVRSVRVFSDDDTVWVEEYTLRTPGAITVALPEQVADRPGFLAIEGTCFGVSVDSGSGTVTLDSVPSGTVPSLYFVDTGSSDDPVLLQDSVVVGEEDTTMVAPQFGSRYLELTLNTTPDGADIVNDVRNFPLVLRLSGLGIPLEELQADGADLVITRGDNRPLPFEVETWDAANGDVTIWALVDTIFANSSDQSLFLFWGGRSFSRPESGTEVFDTSGGFAAVWHLSGRCIDATVNKHDGTRVGDVADTSGVMSGAQRFHGDDYFSIGGLINTPGTVTLSAWAMLDVPDGNGGEVVSVGDAVLIRMDDSWRERGCQGSFYSNPQAESDTLTHECLASGQFLKGTGWHYLTYVADGSEMEHRLYIDGELAREETMPVPIQWQGIGTSTIIGTHGNGKEARDFNGAIDEVRISNVPRSASWIKLCYMSQRQNSPVVSVKGNE